MRAAWIIGISLFISAIGALMMPTAIVFFAFNVFATASPNWNVLSQINNNGVTGLIPFCDIGFFFVVLVFVFLCLWDTRVEELLD